MMQKEFENVEEYFSFFSDEEPEILTELSRETYLKTTHPHMISGHHQGRFLSMISNLIKPKNILEIGAFTGYATLCLAEGLQENGKITTIDHNDELNYFHDKYLRRSKNSNQINLVIGEAKEEIGKLKETFDIIFLDADKENYPTYYTLLMPMLSESGLMLVDNVLWYEKVLSEPEPNDLATIAIRKFNKMVKEDSSVNVVIIPIRDGLSMIKKTSK